MCVPELGGLRREPGVQITHHLTSIAAHPIVCASSSRGSLRCSSVQHVCVAPQQQRIGGRASSAEAVACCRRCFRQATSPMQRQVAAANSVRSRPACKPEGHAGGAAGRCSAAPRPAWRVCGVQRGRGAAVRGAVAQGEQQRPHAASGWVLRPARDLVLHRLRPQIAVSVATHRQELPELTAAVKYDAVPEGTKEALTAAWKSWVEEASEWRAAASDLTPCRAAQPLHIQ